MNKYTLVPSSLQFKSAPEVDQNIDLYISNTTQELTEYDRTTTISLAQVYDDERQSCSVFRPTFKMNYLYNNTLVGTTDYIPFRNNLFYVDELSSATSGIWKGYPQYFEFDFFRPPVNDNHFNYRSKSAYTYNWMYYITYAHENSYTKKMQFSFENGTNVQWISGDGIPFTIINTTYNGKPIVRFQCVVRHGLSQGEFVQTSFYYGRTNVFQVFNLGDGTFGSDEFIFNIMNLGYTGTTFNDKVVGTFKRVTNPANLTETTSSYYVREHKILKTPSDVTLTKNAFEKNPFGEVRKLEYDVLTPNNVTRISQRNSSNSYTFTSSQDIEVRGLLDNQKRPISELFLTIINRGYSGYFNFPFTGFGLKQGWEFNLVSGSTWWDGRNVESNTKIPTSSYTLTNGATKTFYYNTELNVGDVIDGDLCEWNNYEQKERVISNYYQKVKFNPLVFQITNKTDTNSPGYFYQVHHKMSIRVFSDYIETAPARGVDNIPSYAFYSRADSSFRWRDLYTYGFVDSSGLGVDYPFLNSAHYPFTSINFRLIPEQINYVANQINTVRFVTKPEIDDCE